MCVCSTVHMAPHVSANLAVGFCGSMVPALFGCHEAWVLLLFLLPTCCGALEMSLYLE